MAYQKGEVKFDEKTDSRTDDYDTVKGFYLPHSCDVWVIGTKEQAEQLIKDIQELIVKHNL